MKSSIFHPAFRCAALLSACCVFGSFQNPEELCAQTTVSSGSTTAYTSSLSWPITVQSGGTLTLAVGNVGTTSQTLTISGTGNGTIESGGVTYPRGAIYSNVNSSMGQGIFANVQIDGSASTLAESNRIRFQGNVTGGTLTVHSLTNKNYAETHAGYASSFNIEKLIIGTGNFTFNGTNGSSKFAHEHIFTNGIEVANGAFMRIWDLSKGAVLYSDQEKTKLTTVTLNGGLALRCEGGAGTLTANIYLAENSSIGGNTEFTFLGGTITGASGKRLSFDQNRTINFGAGAQVNLPVTQNSATVRFRNGSSMNGKLTLPNGTTTFESGSSMSGSIQKPEESTAVLNLNAGSTAVLTEESTIFGEIKTLSGTLKIGSGTKLTMNGVTTANTENPGTVQLDTDSHLFIPTNTSSVLNAGVVLNGNAKITLWGDSTGSGTSHLTVNSISGAGKTLTFGKTNNPGGSLTADSITLAKLTMGNSANVYVDDLVGSVEFFRVNVFKIGNSLTLGSEGISQHYWDASVSTLEFAADTTLKLMDSVTSASITSDRGNHAVKLQGTTDVSLAAGQTLTWKNSTLSSASGASGILKKSGEGTLNLNVSNSTLSAMNLTDGQTNIAGTWNLSSGLTLDSGAVLSPGNAENAVGSLTLNGTLILNGTLLFDLAEGSGDFLKANSLELRENADILLNLNEGVSDFSFLDDFAFLEVNQGLAETDWENSVTLPEEIADLYDVKLVGNALTLQAVSVPSDPGSNVPEPASWLLLGLGVLGLGVSRRAGFCTGNGTKNSGTE